MSAGRRAYRHSYAARREGEPMSTNTDGVSAMSDELGAGHEARCYVHVHAPQPDDFRIRRHFCPTCNRRTYMLRRHTPWYGVDVTCLRCGEEWQDGQRAERPFAPRWRERNKAAARKLYRLLRTAAPNARANARP